MWSLVLEKSGTGFECHNFSGWPTVVGQGATPEAAFTAWLEKAREADDRLRTTDEEEGLARATAIAHALIRAFDQAVHAGTGKQPIPDSEYQRLIKKFGHPENRVRVLIEMRDHIHRKFRAGQAREVDLIRAREAVERERHRVAPALSNESPAFDPANRDTYPCPGCRCSFDEPHASGCSWCGSLESALIDIPNSRRTTVQMLKLADYLFSSLVEGTKMTTLRNGRRDIVLGPLTFEATNDPEMTRKVDVNSVLHTTLREVPTAVLRDDGFADKHQALVVMRRFYPGITLDSEITAISYRLAES